MVDYVFLVDSSTLTVHPSRDRIFDFFFFQSIKFLGVHRVPEIFFFFFHHNLMENEDSHEKNTKFLAFGRLINSSRWKFRWKTWFLNFRHDLMENEGFHEKNTEFLAFGRLINSSCWYFWWKNWFSWLNEKLNELKNCNSWKSRKKRNNIRNLYVWPIGLMNVPDSCNVDRRKLVNERKREGNQPKKTSEWSRRKETRILPKRLNQGRGLKEKEKGGKPASKWVLRWRKKARKSKINGGAWKVRKY